MNKLIVDEILNLKADDKLYEDEIGCVVDVRLNDVINDVVDSLSDAAERLSKIDVESGNDEPEDVND